ncbi:sigma 54-interacting transcriptional regulator, partial [Brevundimonas sp. SL161]|uniref:sigma 54-interacting transcriptional regulator n=1 Tax=Brevundimonas sp. SL161 TaxID=2804613 RepID=UPI003CFAAD6B
MRPPRLEFAQSGQRGGLLPPDPRSSPGRCPPRSPSAQVTLLRVVEQREIQPLGASGARQLDLRILASCKSDLK